MDIWDTLYQRARETLNPWKISPFVESGGVAAALLTKKGNIYVGVCIDTACSMGMCAERSAIAAMITAGESQIDKIVAVFWDGRVGPPCGVCREFMMQLDACSADIEILMDCDRRTIVTLSSLMPEWWGTDRFAEQPTRLPEDAIK